MKRSALLLVLALVVPVVLGLGGLLLAPDPDAIDTNYLQASPPSRHHLLGTDSLGRDQAARILDAFVPLAVKSNVIGVLGAAVGAAIGFMLTLFRRRGAAKDRSRRPYILCILLALVLVPGILGVAVGLEAAQSVSLLIIGFIVSAGAVITGQSPAQTVDSLCTVGVPIAILGAWAMVLQDGLSTVSLYGSDDNRVQEMLQACSPGCAQDEWWTLIGVGAGVGLLIVPWCIAASRGIIMAVRPT